MRGHIRKRGKSYCAIVYLGKTPDGKTRHKWFTCSTRKEAQNVLNDKLGVVRLGGTLSTSKETVGVFLERWLIDYAAVSEKVGPVTLQSYQDTIRKHLIPALGGGRLAHLSPGMIQRYLTDKLTATNPRNGQPYSPTTIRYQVAVLHKALAHAVRWQALSYNPCDPQRVDFPARRKPTLTCWTPDQMRAFLTTAAARQSPYLPLYQVLITTGCRIGEALALRWSDADLTRGTLTVNQTFYRLGKRQLFKAPKTDKSRRVILLTERVRDVLLDLREQQNDHRRLFGDRYADHGLIFCQADGKPLHAHNIGRRDFRTVIEAAKVPRCRVHDLRHLSASLLLSNGVPLPVVSERLGHSRQSTTLNFYSHVLPGGQEAAALAMEGQMMVPQTRALADVCKPAGNGKPDRVKCTENQSVGL